MCGSNGPPGRTYLEDAQLSNCGYVTLGRIPLVAMNDALWSWLFALLPPKDHDRLSNGLAMPVTSYWPPFAFVPASSLYRYEPC